MAFPLKKSVSVDANTGAKTKTISYLGKNVKYVRDVTKSKDGKDKVVKSALGVGNANGEFKAFKSKTKSSFEGKRVEKGSATTLRNKEGQTVGGNVRSTKYGMTGKAKTSVKENPVTGKYTSKEKMPNKEFNTKFVMKKNGKMISKDKKFGKITTKG